MTHEQLKKHRRRMDLISGLIVLTVTVLTILALIFIVRSWEEKDEEVERDDVYESPYHATVIGTEVSESVDLEINLVDHPQRSYYREGVPLDRYQQETLWNACQEWGVPYELALAVCWRETGYQDRLTIIELEDGTVFHYYGMMAVQLESAGWYMEQCGVEYLNSEEDKLRVGCCILGYYLDMYDGNLHRTLMSYNAGSPKADKQWALGVYYTTYTLDVTNYMKKLMEA